MKKIIKLIIKVFYFIKLPFLTFSEDLILYLKPTKFNCRIKSQVLRIRGAKIGKNLFLDRGILINNPKNIFIGDDVVIAKDVVITTGGDVHIGNRVLIGYGSKILSANHKIPDDITKPIRFSGHDFKKVVLEDDVWICSNVVILPGIKVGKGSVVAAGAVVTKDVDEYSIVGGIPACLIKKRH